MRLALLAVSPMLLLFFDAKYFVKKLDLPGRAEAYRARMRKDHNIDKQLLAETLQQVDQTYGISEKEEIEQMKQLGYGPKDTLALKHKATDPPPPPSSQVTSSLAKSTTIRLQASKDLEDGSNNSEGLSELTGKTEAGDLLVS